MSSKTQLKPGSTLQGGKYRIISVLGQGGFGITYEAEQVALGRKVAVKEFFMEEYCNRDSTTSQVSVGSEGSKETVERFRAKFVKEAKMIAGLDHQNIIRIHDVFEENGTAYYVMEYLSGGSLLDLQKLKGRLSESDALGYIRQAASALDYIHSLKINHLDIKPGNILLDGKGRAVLIDFGLSKRYDVEGNQTSTTPVGISHGYAPLEQYKTGGVGTFSPATDIYSLGATLYRLLTGQTPPDADVINDDGFPDNPGYVSEYVWKAIEAAMQPRRKDRPQSIADVLKILDGTANAGADDDTTILKDDETHIQDDKTGFEEDSTQFTTRLDVETTPSDANVILDGKSLGLTPIKGYEVTIGQHELRIEKSGYEPYNTRMTFGTEPLIINKTLGKEPIPVPMPSWLKRAVFVVAGLLIALGLFYNLRPDQSSQSQPDTQTSSSNAQSVQQFKPTTGTHNGHDWVDLGLSVKWATCNVGALSPSDYGNYYAWGEVRTKSEYRSSNCTTYEKSMGDIAGNSTYDAARYNWGGKWRLPTEAECQELVDNCTWTWTTLGGHNGIKVTSKKTGASIFLPAAGRYCWSLDHAGVYCAYWSSTPVPRGTSGAYSLNVTSGHHDVGWNDRDSGRSVRPVSE